MGFEGQDFEALAGSVSPAFVDALYQRYQASPDSVEPAWRALFEGLDGAAHGPSWGNPQWA
ncbi:MAG: 2-oxoglutarate dehydrogenase E1 subunit family protein, partial [Sphingomonas sp.]